MLCTLKIVCTFKRYRHRFYTNKYVTNGHICYKSLSILSTKTLIHLERVCRVFSWPDGFESSGVHKMKTTAFSCTVQLNANKYNQRYQGNDLLPLDLSLILCCIPPLLISLSLTNLQSLIVESLDENLM